MSWFVLLTLALLIAGGGLIAAWLGWKLGFLVTGVTIVVFAVITVFMSFGTVQNGHIGVTKQFGSLVGTTGEGLVSHGPWQSISEVSVQNELATYDMTANNSAVSKDSQPVYMVVQVNYSLRKDKAVDLYKETGGDFKTVILDPAVFQDVKEVTAKYQATEFAANRETIRRKIERKLSQEVGSHGLTINNVALKNVAFTGALSRAIEQTVEARQQAARAAAQVEISKAEANKTVATAEGEKRSEIARAEGKATATKLQAQATAFANRVKRKSLTPLLVQQSAIDKLNPAVKVIVCQQGQICIPQAVIATAAAGQ